MKKIEKMIHQIIRFRGKIEAFFVSIEEFSSPTKQTARQPVCVCADDVWSCGGAVRADTRSGNRQLQSPAQPSPASSFLTYCHGPAWSQSHSSDNRPLQNKMTPPALGLHISYSCGPIHQGLFFGMKMVRFVQPLPSAQHFPN